MEEVFERFGCGFFDSRCRRDFGQRSPVRTVHGYELELFTEEEGASYIGEVRYVVRRGMLLCAKPGQTRHSELPVRCYYIRLPAGDAAVDRILDRLPDVTYLGDGHDCEEMLEGINRLIRLHCGGEEMGEDERLLCTRAVLYEVLGRCVAVTCRQIGAGDGIERPVRAACDYIDRYYTGACTLREIAEQVHMSPNYLHALFRREMGMTPLEYVMRKRIAMAKRLIVAGEATLLEVALSTGFCSQSHFNRIFRERTGETPAAYRRRMMDQY